MTLVKFLSSEKLVEYLDEELRLFLNAREIYEINQYGWLIDDRPDPEYLGLAMWQTEPPRSRNKIASISNINGGQATSQTDPGRIFKTGLEFEELMKSSRHSIGLAYLYHKDSDNIDHCYSYHFSDTAMKLRRATDRLRDFFIDAFCAIPGFDIQEEYPSASGNSQEQRHIFCRPFEKTREILAKSPEYYEELFDCVEDLLPLIEQTSFYRIEGDNRNHEYLGADNQFAIAIDTIAQTEEITELSDQGPDGETLTHSMSEWYKLLIKTSNQVFLAEYLIRNSDKKSAITHIGISH